MVLVSDYIGPDQFGAICTDCVPIIPQEFHTSEQRDDWVTRHGTTGHTAIIVVNGPKGATEQPIA